jgi:hypothetical protein
LRMGTPHFSQNGSTIRGTRSWQSGHQRKPALPQPPHTGGKSKSSPLHVNRLRRYDQGMLLTDYFVFPIDRYRQDCS